MEILTKRDFTLRKRELQRKIMEGAIFIYPTDTIYGIGCNALNSAAIQKIRKIKQRPNSAFSIWAPNKEWIQNNCDTSSELATEYLDKLPGPYTLILLQKKGHHLPEIINPAKNSLGVRIPHHYLSNFFHEMEIPIITTSVNKSGERFMTTLETLDPDIQAQVNFIIYDGEIKNKPSKIINCVTKEEIERE
ncbi:threonylcarbamoyl-AMP synthase [archaeon]|jgi:tRNA threonylcarbamoyl adenosine modification protein (Sua5/YciO/YrdC/YwlC family)|nr:threonylcarbamoyl-AMP synthase [archaeon]MBT6761787.1 threonylcarbamoyl-AMP synthase [archaeon]